MPTAFDPLSEYFSSKHQYSGLTTTCWTMWCSAYHGYGHRAMNYWYGMQMHWCLRHLSMTNSFEWGIWHAQQALSGDLEFLPK